MGRHVSSERRRSLRGRFFLALLAMIVLLCAAAYAAYQIWDHGREHAPARHGPPAASASATPVASVTLTVTVTGAKCQVFVRVPGGDILVNRSLVRGQSVRFDEQSLSVVLGDGSAAQVYVNGRLRPPGRAGKRVEFVATKG
ncbi:hypothetical protein [Actinoallomurus bryophytorum]|uniref:hypothetical protein n=1 Tax=Actinoallomurus bryophytorum TaxID=1490222 RepID=UPI00114D95BF|nr:hypothetical protein [Actinoallomurus bryophytorum]